MSGVAGSVLSHCRPGAWSHPDEDLASYVCWGNPESLVVVVGVLGHGHSLERDSRWIAELFRSEIWTWDRWTVWAGGGEASWLLFLERGQWLKEPGILLCTSGMHLRWDIGLMSERGTLIRNWSMIPLQPLQRRQNLQLLQPLWRLQKPPKKPLFQPLSWKKVSQVLKVKGAGQRGTGQWTGNVPGQTSKILFLRVNNPGWLRHRVSGSL